MATTIKYSSSISIPVTLEQVAQAVRKLSPRELETLEILMDREATRTIGDSVRQKRSGKLKKLL